MGRAIAGGVALVLAAVAAFWFWHSLLTTPAMETSAVIQAGDRHAYQYIAAPDLSWERAGAAAARLSWHGLSGHLATIDAAAEYQFVLDHVFSRGYPDVTYLGGRQTAAGEWRWVAGPDGLADGGKGRLFWRGDEQGAVQNDLYANWMSTAFQHGGKWDMRKVCCVSLFSYGVPQFSTSLGTGDPEEHVSGYLVEFGN